MKKSISTLIVLFILGAAIFASGCVTGTGKHTDTISGVEYTADGVLGTCKTWKVYLTSDNGLPAKNKDADAWDGIYSLDNNSIPLQQFLLEASTNKKLVTVETQEIEATWPCTYHGKTVITNASYVNK